MVNLNKEYIICFPNKDAAERSDYTGKVIGQFTSKQNSEEDYFVVSIEAFGRCEKILNSDESNRIISL